MKKWEDIGYLRMEYVDKERSTSSIAKENKTHPNTIRRALKKAGISIRNKSQAQKNYIDKHGAPMTGRKRSQREKDKISMGRQRWWESLTEKQRNSMKSDLSNKARSQWNNLTDAEKNKRIKKMHAASRDKTHAGSKNENMIAELLRDMGYIVFQRTKQYSPARRFEIDVAIPNEQIAIEWDGVTHFSPVYGEEYLSKVRVKDETKNAMLLAAGWTVIRCQDHSTASTAAFCRRALKRIVDVIDGRKKNVVHQVVCK